MAGLAAHFRRFGRVVAWAGVVFSLMLVTGCRIVRAPANQTEALLRSVTGKKQTTNQLSILQSEVMREADNYAAGVAEACDDFAHRVGTLDAKQEALRWKLQQSTAAYMNATGENPALNAVDMAVLASLSYQVAQDYWLKEYGDPAKPLVEMHRKLRDNVWVLVDQVLSPSQKQELRDVLEEWSRKNPTQRYVAAVHLRDFAQILGKKSGQDRGNSQVNNLFSLLNVDPLSGLDPAIAAIEQTRLLAERMMYYFERAPTLLSWQVELMTYRLSDQPAAQQMISNVTSLSQSAEIFAKTAQQLPALVNDQRTAAINQFFAGISNERSNIFESLNSQDAKLRELLPQVRETLATAGTTANSLDSTIKSLDSFVRYVSPPDTNPPVVSTNSKPFNILDYGTAAGQIGMMATQVNNLITSANQSATQIAVLGEQAGGKAQEVVDRAFRLGLLLVVILLAGCVVAALAYRALANRLLKPRNESPVAKS